ncbi:MAG: ATP-binding protein [Candidatus Dormibacteria bacterium]
MPHPRLFVRVLGPLRSLRWRLTLSYLLLLAVLLVLLGAYQQVALRRTLDESRVASLAGDLETAREAALRSNRRVDGVPVNAAAILCSVGSQRALGVAGAFANTVAVASGHTAAVLLYDRDLQPLAIAPVTADPPRLDAGRLNEALAGHPTSAQIVGGDGVPRLLLVGFPLLPSRTGCGVAQLSVPTQPLDDVLAGQRRQYTVSALITLAVALIIGLLLTGGMLRPLDRVTATARRLAAGDLRARSNIAPRGDEVGVLAGAFDDMASRIELAFAQQAESEQRTRRFVADASHELRTPLTALKGYIDVLRRGAGRDRATLDATLETMAREAERMRLLVLDLLALARLDAQRPLELRPLDLNAAVTELLDEGAAEQPATVARQLADPPVVALADPEAVTTILRNLWTNACRYAPGAAQRYSTARDGDDALLVVHDEGPGIPAGDQPHVFERFYRGEKTRTRDEGGSGLGLAIVDGLARAMRGTVSVESHDGAGSTFTVRLPLAPRGGVTPTEPITPGVDHPVDPEIRQGVPATGPPPLATGRR